MYEREILVLNKAIRVCLYYKKQEDPRASETIHEEIILHILI